MGVGPPLFEYRARMTEDFYEPVQNKRTCI